MLFYQSEEQNREKMANTAPLGENTLPLAVLGDAPQSGVLRERKPLGG